MAAARACFVLAACAGGAAGRLVDSDAPAPTGSDHVMLQVAADARLRLQRSAAHAAATRGADCCSKCGGSGYCSPESWNCYETKAKDYYLTCASASNEDCCSKCSDSAHCSPFSGQCYDTKRKDYYLTCKETTTTTTTPCVGDNCEIGWPTGGEMKSQGLWCEIPTPPEGWSALKTCQTGPNKQRIKVLSYNLFWWNLFERRRGENGRAGRKIASTSSPEPYDFMGFQESKDVDRVMRDARSHGLPDEYKTLSLVWEDRALGMAYRNTWTLLENGHQDVGEDTRQQYYGKRAVLWGRFQHQDGHTAFFINHHGPLPVSASGWCAGSATAYNIMRVVAEHAKPRDALILVGDFNAQPHSSRVQALDKYMHRVFSGNSMGSVDHIYSNCAGDAVLKKENLGTGGSDHDALSVVLEFSLQNS
eukprot:TRINITY_DN1961_c0_g1_i1.p1 TRINITY_DN1961_c0_g1~~TRINITY_DN1961_c0_g1_i1.p1  ORF type:complete len:419 (+),score=77.15 TRINITY_DN1961_c0_g1_i1:78-1334(+)